MRTDLLTREEFDRRLPRTYREAILLSIEKWERIRLSGNWNDICDRYGGLLWGRNCGLCYWFHRRPGVSNNVEHAERCRACPLVDCDGERATWYRVLTHQRAGNRRGFMRNSLVLLRKLRAALAAASD